MFSFLSSFYFHPSMLASLYVFLTSNSFHCTDHLLYYTYKHNTLYHTSAWHDHIHIHSALTQPLRPYSSLLNDISDTEIHPIAVSDHAAVSLTLVNKKATPPSNNWRFNTSLNTSFNTFNTSIHHCLKTTILLNILKKSGLYI